MSEGDRRSHGGDHWSHVDALLKKALDREPEQRAEFLSAACGGDAALQREVERLLELAALDDDLFVPGGGDAGDVWEDAALELAEPGPGEPRPGERIGSYEIRGLLGEGGMGRVYRGWDPALGREVALKALAQTFSGAPESLRRFEREAKLLAALNHPNIGAIYELLSEGDQKYLVLELVEGETLEERLEQGPLPFAETIRIARQLADALEEAHRKGVVHRDLKPTNVMITPGGRIKVLDFGLAKAEVREEGGASTLVSTRSGVVLGTAAYMSPEQARGEPVDRRADIWGFGCLGYEMRTGERVFLGRSGPDTLAAVLRDPVDFSRLPGGTPPGLRRLVRRCLQKDVENRLQDIGDARLELADLTARTTAAMRPAGHRQRLRPRSLAAVLPWLVAGLAIAVALGVLLAPGREAATRAPLRSLALLPGPGLALPADYAPPFAITRDGSCIAFRAGREGEPSRLWVRQLDSPTARELHGTEEARQPFFSPDGRSLGFFADRMLKLVSVEGGPVRSLIEIGGNPRGASWSESGVILVAPSQTSGLLSVDARTGAATELTRIDASAQERSHRWPHVLPGGKLALFTVQPEAASFDDARIEAVRLSDGSRHVVAEGGSHPVFSPSGHLLYARQGRLYGVRLDPGTATRRGVAVPVLDGVAYSPRNGGAQFAVAGDGTLVYGPGAVTSLERQLVWVDGKGEITRLPTAPRRFSDPRISPDGRRIAVRIGPGDHADLWVLDARNGTLTQLTFDERVHRPEWGPGPGSVTWATRAGERWRISAIDADASSPARTLVESPNRIYPTGWTPDGRGLVYQERRGETGWDLRLQRFDASGKAESPSTALLARPANEERGRVSPDGRWLAYESDELDAVVEVYVRRFDGAGAATRITGTGGRFPLWGGHQTLYAWRTDADRLLEVQFPTEGPAAPRPVWPGAPPQEAGLVESRLLPMSTEGGDVDAERGRFLLMAPLQPDEPKVQDLGLVVVLGWGDELERRMQAP